MTTLILFVVCVWAVKSGLRAYQQAEMKKTSPEVWMRLQEMEHQKRVMRHDGMKSAAGIGLTVIRLLSGK